MKAYLIGFSSRDTKNLMWIDEYMSLAPEILKKYNAEVLMTGKPEIITQGTDWERVTVIQFPSKNKLKNFHKDAEYLNLKILRIKNTIGEMYFLYDDYIN